MGRAGDHSAWTPSDPPSAPERAPGSIVSNLSVLHAINHEFSNTRRVITVASLTASLASASKRSCNIQFARWLYTAWGSQGRSIANTWSLKPAKTPLHIAPITNTYSWSLQGFMSVCPVAQTKTNNSQDIVACPQLMDVAVRSKFAVYCTGSVIDGQHDG